MARQTEEPKVPSAMRSAMVALVSVLLFAAADVRADNDAREIVADLTVAQDQSIDEDLEGFDDPVLIRAKARVAPPWRGPLGQPPWTERRNCPEVVLGTPDFPPYC